MTQTVNGEAGETGADTAKAGTPPDPATARASADKSAAEAAKIRAEAAKIEAEVQGLALDLENRRSPTAVLAAESGNRKTLAENDKAAAAARREAVGALIPDVSGVTASTLEVTGDALLWAPVAAHRALLAVAAEIKERLQGVLPDEGPTVLVTTDPDLLQGEFAYREVTGGVAQLRAAVGTLLDSLSDKRQAAHDASLAGVGDVAAAIAKALPGVLSLFAAKRSVTTKLTSVSEQAAVAAVIGALDPGDTSRSFNHPTFRLLGDAGIYADLTAVAGSLDTVRAHRLEQQQAKVASSAARSARQAELDTELAAEAADVKAGKPLDPERSARIEKLQQEVNQHAADVAVRDNRLVAIETVLAAAAAFLDSIRLRDAAGGPTPLERAATHQRMYVGGTGYHQFSDVLLLTVESGGGYQSVSNRPLFFNDRFSTSVDVTLSYLLFNRERNAIAASGVATRTASVHGSIGGKMQVDIDA